MSVKRAELVRYLEQHGFQLLREGGNHSIYSNGDRIVPVKRHRTLDRITANELCKQAGLRPRF
jgi:predicted RNA binding protein YcfA (HicA-like mRNA interferase family)